MATSTCPKCTSTSFEMKTGEPRGSRMKVMYVQCFSCGAVVGVVDYFDTATMLDKIAKKIGVDIFK